jgi:hypothetical protein
MGEMKMTKEQAGWEAERISKFYGAAVVFREPSCRESYQASTVGGLAPGCVVIAQYLNGAEAAE